MNSSVEKKLSERIEDLLPQTQCTKCGYPSCRLYAQAIATDEAPINQCPPGGAEGIARLAILLVKPVLALNPQNGVERERSTAQIDESVCIGCTRCIQVCPVDAIVGCAKSMHTVIRDWCTGCDLCVSACPVDCITMLPVSAGKTGWHAWSQAQADEARAHYNRRSARLQHERAQHVAIPRTQTATTEQSDHERKQALARAALERVRQRKETT